MSNLVVSRFTEETLESNRLFRHRKRLGCLYGTSLLMRNFQPNEVVCVIEMNLDKNRIEGIGLVLNDPKRGPQYTMYQHYYYNLYAYCGKYRLDREDIETLTALPLGSDRDPEKPRVMVVEVLDRLLFTGKSHMKRGSYFSRLTDRLIYKGGTSCEKVQDAILNKFVEKFSICIQMEEGLLIYGKQHLEEEADTADTDTPTKVF